MVVLYTMFEIMEFPSNAKSPVIKTRLFVNGSSGGTRTPDRVVNPASGGTLPTGRSDTVLYPVS